MLLRHERKMYPPQVKMTVRLQDSTNIFKIPVKVFGCSTDSELDVELTFPIDGMYTNPLLHVVVYNIMLKETREW